MAVTFIGVDLAWAQGNAPLVVTNASGQCPCETLVSRRFVSADAPAHSTNLSRPTCGVALAREPHPAQVVLFERDRIIRYKKGPLAVRRSGLEELRSEIRRRILHAIPSFESTPEFEEFLSCDPGRAPGKVLDRYEDQLDAIFCSYLAFHLWRFGWERSEMLGDLATGYTVVPSAPLAARARAWHFRWIDQPVPAPPEAQEPGTRSADQGGPGRAGGSHRPAKPIEPARRGRGIDARIGMGAAGVPARVQQHVCEHTPDLQWSAYDPKVIALG